VRGLPLGFALRRIGLVFGLPLGPTLAWSPPGREAAERCAALHILDRVAPFASPRRGSDEPHPPGELAVKKCLHADGEHYTREITNLGRHPKKLVGTPR
jgi:hypothetical protein